MEENKKKSRIPYLFFIFFAVIFAVDGIYIYLAKKTWRGLATEDGYQKGLHYNQTIEAVKKQQELGWKSEIKRDGKILRFSLKDKKNNLIKNAKVIAKITRPVQEGYDFEQELIFDAKNSAYIAKIDFPIKGQWDIDIIASVGDIIYQDSKRIVLQ